MEQLSFKEFSDNILHRGKYKKKPLISGSVGVYDCYKWIRKNKWLDLPRALTENEFYSIIRSVNNLLQDKLLRGESVELPYKLGTIEVLKSPTKLEFIEGKLRTTKRINWKETLKLWYEDEESRYSKTLIRYNADYNIRIQYNKSRATYNNKSFYLFKPNKTLNIKLKKLFSEGLIDALQLDYGMEGFKHKR